MAEASVVFDASTVIDMMIFDMRATLDVIDCCRPLGSAAIASDEAEATAQVFKALADPARVKIVSIVASSDAAVCACEFAPALGLTQATASHHLKKLTEVGLLEREQRGKWAYFSLDPEAGARLAGIVRLQEVVS